MLQVKQTVWDAGFLTDIDLDHGTTLNKKIRNAQLAQYNFIFGEIFYLICFIKIRFDCVLALECHRN